jgi:hypothetical protein
MADEVALAGTGSTAKLRNPWGVIGLSIITIGIYYFFKRDGQVSLAPAC